MHEKCAISRIYDVMHILKIVFYDVIVTIHRISPSIGRGNKVWIFLGSLKKKVTTSEYKGYI